MEQEQRDEISTFAKQQFAFLKAEKGFTKPLINRPDYTLLIYRSATIGVRIEMDTWGISSMEIMIGKLGTDGKFPLSFPPPSEGDQRKLWLLESLLIRQFQVQDERFLPLDKIRRAGLRLARRNQEWSNQQWKHVIGLYQALLQDHIDLIVQSPLEVLFPDATAYLPMWHTRTEWVQLATTHFAFLEEYGFRPSPIYGADSWLDIYTWLSADRGIQLTVDHRDMGLDCDLVSLIDGKIPATDKDLLKRHNDFIEGQGRTIPLIKLLGKRLGIADPEIESVDNLHSTLSIRHWTDYDYRYVSAFIIGHANLVRHHIKMLMETPLKTLFASAHLNYNFIDV